MSQLLLHPAVWGIGGAFVYAGSTASNALWNVAPVGEASAEARRRKHIYASFVLAMVFGPLAAEVGTGDLAAWLTVRLGHPPADRAVAVGIGLFAAPLWPVALKLTRLKLLGWAATLIKALQTTKETPP